MPSTIAHVSGLRELGEAMRALTGKDFMKIAHAATSAGASVVRKAAIAAAPESDEAHALEGTPIEPGNLKRNIVSKRLRAAETRLTSEYIVTVRGRRKHGYASRYGSMLEFGTVKMGAQPFLGPALSQNLARVQDNMKRRLEARLKKAGVR